MRHPRKWSQDRQICSVGWKAPSPHPDVGRSSRGEIIVECDDNSIKRYWSDIYRKHRITFSDVVPVRHRLSCTKALDPSSPDTADCACFSDNVGLLLVERRVGWHQDAQTETTIFNYPAHSTLACLSLYKYACLTDSGPVHCARRFSVALATSLTRGRMGGKD